MKLGPIHWRKFERFLLFCGCVLVHEEGDHRKYHRPGLPRGIVVPRWEEIPVFIIKSNLRTLGISREEYLKILQEKL